MTPPKHKPALTRCAAIAALLLLFSPALDAQNSGRGFVKAQAGTTLPGLDYGLAAGGGFGVRLTESLDLFAEAGTVREVCEYALIGARFTLPIRSVVTPFFEIGGGGARLAPHLQSEQPAFYKLAATGGLHLAATRRFGFDFAYRYFRISTGRPALAGSQAYVGIVYRF